MNLKVGSKGITMTYYRVYEIRIITKEGYSFLNYKVTGDKLPFRTIEIEKNDFILIEE